MISATGTTMYAMARPSCQRQSTTVWDWILFLQLHWAHSTPNKVQTDQEITYFTGDLVILLLSCSLCTADIYQGFYNQVA